MKKTLLTMAATLILATPAVSQPWYQPYQQQQQTDQRQQMIYNQDQQRRLMEEQNRIQQDIANQQRWRNEWQQQRYQPVQPFGSFWDGFQKGKGR